MAIVVESEKKKSPTVAIAIAIIVIVILVAGTYYLFFSPAPAIQNIIVPRDLQSISQVSKLDVNGAVQSLTSSANYNSLKNTLPPQQVNGYGRSDPFQPY